MIVFGGRLCKQQGEESKGECEEETDAGKRQLCIRHKRQEQHGNTREQGREVRVGDKRDKGGW